MESHREKKKEQEKVGDVFSTETEVLCQRLALVGLESKAVEVSLQHELTRSGRKLEDKFSSSGIEDYFKSLQLHEVKNDAAPKASIQTVPLGERLPCTSKHIQRGDRRYKKKAVEKIKVKPKKKVHGKKRSKQMKREKFTNSLPYLIRSIGAGTIHPSVLIDFFRDLSEL